MDKKCLNFPEKILQNMFTWIFFTTLINKYVAFYNTSVLFYLNEHSHIIRFDDVLYFTYGKMEAQILSLT